MARKIDDEVRSIIHTAHNRAREIMNRHRKTLDELAQQLIQKETLNEAEVEALLAGATS